MPRFEAERSRLEKAWSEAFAEYTSEVNRTLALLNFKDHPTGPQLKELEEQRTAERIAFEKYRRARRAYIEFLQGAGGFAIILATHMLAHQLR